MIKVSVAAKAGLLAAMVVVAAAWNTQLNEAGSRKTEECNGFCLQCTEPPEEETYGLYRLTTEPSAFFEVEVDCEWQFPGPCSTFDDNCDPPGAPELAAELSEAVENGDMDEVRELIRTHENLAYIAPERSRIQMLNCQKQVGRQIALTPKQLKQLAD